MKSELDGLDILSIIILIGVVAFAAYFIGKEELAIIMKYVHMYIGGW